MTEYHTLHRSVTMNSIIHTPEAAVSLDIQHRSYRSLTARRKQLSTRQPYLLYNKTQMDYIEITIYYPKQHLLGWQFAILLLLMLLLLGRITLLRAQMWPIITQVAWSVYHDREPCKHGWTNSNALWVVDSGGPNVPLDGVQIAHGKGAILTGKGVVHCKV